MTHAPAVPSRARPARRASTATAVAVLAASIASAWWVVRQDADDDSSDHPTTAERAPTVGESGGDPAVDQSGPWCRVQGRSRLSCTRWLAATPGEPTAWVGVASTIVVRRSTSGMIEARAADDGRPLWRRNDLDAREVVLEGSVITRTPALVVALDPATGTEVWRVATTSPPVAIAATATALAVLDRDGGVAVLDPATGATRWELDGLAASAMVLRDGHLVLASASAGTLVGLDAADGARRWDVRLTATAAEVLLDAAPGRVVATTTLALGLQALGEIVELDVATGEVLWRTDLPADRAGRSPVIVTEHAVVVGLRGPGSPSLYGLDLQGDQSWALSLVGDSAVPVTAGPGAVLVDTAQGVIALDETEGSVAWSMALDVEAVSERGGQVAVASTSLLLMLDPPG